MLADLDETLRKLLTTEMRIKNNDIEIQFDQPTREWSARISRPTVNLFLYDLRENSTLRHHQWERMQVSGADRLAHLKRTPYRVDCCYLITCWTSEPEDEHRLMTAVLLTLFKHPTLPKKYFQGNMIHQPFDVQLQLAGKERLNNPSDLWSAMDNEMRLGVSLMITLAFDPWPEVTGPMVRTFTLRSGQTITLPDETELIEPQHPHERIFIGGTVWKGKVGQHPQDGVEINVAGERCLAVTDRQGRFRIGSLPPGNHTLLIHVGGKQVHSKEITIPAEDGNYDIIL